MWCCKKYADRLLIVLLQKREKAEVKSGGIYFGKIEKNAGNAFFGRNIKENERMLSIYLERLDFVIEQERKEQREKQRVAGAVSVIGGMMLVILFI